MKVRLSKIFALLIVLTMVVSPVAAQSPLNETKPNEPPTQLDAASSSSKEFINRDATVVGEIKGAKDPATYIIQLVDASVASYRGGITGLAATNASVNGTVKLDVNTPESQAYAQYLEAQQANFINAMAATVGAGNVKVRFQYKFAFNGLAVVMYPEDAAQVAKMPGVSMVKRETVYKLTTDVSPEFIGVDGIWDGTSTGGLPPTKGEGIIIGVIDTGINFDSPSFAEVGPVDGYVHVNPNGSGNYLGWCDPGNPNYDASYTCNDKLIGAWDYADDTGDESDGPWDSHSHGSHTASTSGGNTVETVIDAPTTSYTPTLSGMAPHANIIAYDVCTNDSGCPESYSIAATDQAVVDGVDVINFSIGGGSSDPWADAGSLAFLNAIDAGVIVVTSAGNDGPNPGTMGSPGDAPWMFTVGNSTHNRIFENSLINMSGGDTTPPADLTGMGLTAGYGPAPIVYAGDFPSTLTDTPELCGVGDIDDFVSPWPPGTFNGEIVVCDRGIFGRVEKGANVLAAGAGGYVLANTDSQGESTNGDPHELPAVHIGDTDGDILRAWLASGSGHMATITGYTLDTSGSLADIMAAGSSRGPASALPSIVKPDIAAPGTDILAAYKDGDTYGMMSGTSMASPHVAGAAALMRALYPSWTVAQIKSAIMTTSWMDMLKEDHATPAIAFDRGAGRVDMNTGALAGLVLDETTQDFLDADPSAGGFPTDLNIASFADDQCLQNCLWDRVVSNTLPVSVTWTASIDAPEGITLTVTPSSFEIGPHAEQMITVHADATAATPDEWAFGDITLQPSDTSIPDAHFPVAVYPTLGIFPDSITIETRRNAGSQLVEDLQSLEITDLTIDAFGLTQATMDTFYLMEDPTNDDPYDDLDQVYVAMVEVPAGAKRLVAEITQSEAPDVDMFVISGGFELCASTTGSWREYCDLTDPAAGTYYVVVQNWAGSANQPDMITLATAVVPGTDAGNLMVTGPDSVPPLTPFDLRVFWDTPNMMVGDRWYGTFMVGADASTPIATIPVDIHRESDDITKSADKIEALPGDMVTYTITIEPNITPADLNYELTDRIPHGLTYVPGSVDASSGTANAVLNTVTWTGAATSAVPGLVDLGFNGYYDISGFPTTIALCSYSSTCDETGFNLTGMDFYYLGEHYDAVYISANGFASVGDTYVNDGFAWLNQDLPDSAIPNNTLAPWWTDLDMLGAGDSTGAGAWYLNFGVTDGTTNWTVIQWDGAQLYGDPSSFYTFQIWITEGSDEIYFSYDSLNGDTSVATVGLENMDGTVGAMTYYNGTGTLPSDDLFAGYVPAPPITISYAITVDDDVPLNTVLTNLTEHQTDNPGSKVESTGFDLHIGLRNFFPIINR